MLLIVFLCMVWEVQPRAAGNKTKTLTLANTLYRLVVEFEKSGVSHPTRDFKPPYLANS